VWCYETKSGVWRKLLQTPANSDITDVACSPAGDMVAAVVSPHGAQDIPKRLLLLDANTGSLLKEFEAARGTRPRFTPGGRMLVYGAQRDLHLVDLHRDENRLIRNAHLDSQAGLSVSEDGRWLATCSEGRDLRIWNLATLELHAVLQGHQGKISALQFSADSRTLFSSSFDGTVKAWSVAIGEHLMDLHQGAEGVSGMALSHDGCWLAIVEGKRRVRVYSLGRNDH
jgi:WD40 repeat protein